MSYKQPPSEALLKVMERFRVDEDTAKEIMAFCNTLCLEKMKKWKRNFRSKKTKSLEDEKQHGKIP